jgi:hypothetical protein
MCFICYPNIGSYRIDHLISENGTSSSWFTLKEIETIFNGRCFTLQLKDDFRRFTTFGN